MKSCEDVSNSLINNNYQFKDHKTISSVITEGLHDCELLENS